MAYDKANGATAGLEGYVQAFNSAAHVASAQPQQNSSLDVSQSFMARLSHQTYHVNAFNAQDHMRSAALGNVGDMSQLKTAVAAHKEDVQQTQTAFVSDMQKAQAVVLATIKDAAQGMNLDPGNAIASIVPNANHVSTIVSAGIEAAGQGSLVTALKAVSMSIDIASEAKKLNLEEQKALMEEVHRRLTSPADPQSNDSNFFTIAPAGKDNDMQASPYNWEALAPQEIAEFVKARPEEQPEKLKIDAALQSIAEVEENHDYVDARITAGEVEMVGESLRDISISNRPIDGSPLESATKADILDVENSNEPDPALLEWNGANNAYQSGGTI